MTTNSDGQGSDDWRENQKWVELQRRLPDDPDTLSDPAKVKQALDVDPTAKTWWCPLCGLNYSPGKPCASCRKHAALGELAGMLIWNHPMRPQLKEIGGLFPSPGELLALDAIATILGDTPNATRGW